MTNQNLRKIYWRMTDKCNYNCAHCAYDCNQDGHTVSLGDAKRIFDNLPSQSQIKLSGGEVATESELLFEILKYINS